jgi:hypothetical protein
MSEKEKQIFDDHLIERILGINDGQIDDEARQKRLLKKEIETRYSIENLKRGIGGVPINHMTAKKTKIRRLMDKKYSVPDKLILSFYEKKKI